MANCNYSNCQVHIEKLFITKGVQTTCGTLYIYSSCTFRYTWQVNSHVYPSSNFISGVMLLYTHIFVRYKK